MAFAHSRNAQGERHDLLVHLQEVASLAERFARPLHAPEIARWLGLWHDIGKISPTFQSYLLASEAGHRPPGHSPDHKGAGTLQAIRQLGPLGLIVQGHHGELAALPTLKAWLSDAQHLAAAEESLRAACTQWPQVVPPAAIPLPQEIVGDQLGAELLMRLLYSALVDADYTDTENHFHGLPVERELPPDMAELWQRFERNQSQITGQRTDIVSQVRDAIYHDCVAAAEGEPSLFRLRVPTGGGKTRSALAFALRHALRHGMERIIVAIPFISITEQTASIYREIFEAATGAPVVLEHHSSAQTRQPGEADNGWVRLSAENWDAPIIVTTTVQLFDSLFANRPQAVRKLHRLANSVIILDEVQALPPGRLAPILDVLTQLTRHYHTTVVLSTATQPAFEAIPAFHDLRATEIIVEPGRYFAALERVHYDWRLDTPLSWAQVAALMVEQEQALAIVNTKRDALSLYQAVLALDPDALHLSAGMCGQHRRETLKEIRNRLNDRSPCRVVSTQVVEAGVDVDFPLVLRASGPLDAIIQAAGRCNREGHLAFGQVIVYEPEEGTLPPGPYSIATNQTRVVLGAGDLNPNSPQAADRYYSYLYSATSTDRDHVQACRERLDFPETARLFKLIDDDTVGVVVRFGSAEQQQHLDETVDQLQNHWGNPRLLLRALQPYMVNLRRQQAERLSQRGLVHEILPGLGLWLGTYDPLRGLIVDDPGPSDLIV